MPLHRIYSVPGTFSAEDKAAMSKHITEMYVKSVGLPPFYVIVLFLPVEQEDFFVGGKSNQEGKFVRILVDHIARSLPWNIQVVRFLSAYESILAPFIKDRGLDWEIQVTEADANLWRQNGLIPPVPSSDAEKEWIRQNKPVPFTDEQNQ